MSQDILINKLFYSKDPFEDLNTVRPYYDGSYVRVKFDTYMDGVLNYTMRLGTNVFRGTYLHQLMEILNLYFGL